MAQEGVPLARVSSSAPSVCHPLPGSHLFIPVARSSPPSHGPKSPGTVGSAQLPENPEFRELRWFPGPEGPGGSLQRAVSELSYGLADGRSGPNIHSQPR